MVLSFCHRVVGYSDRIAIGNIWKPPGPKSAGPWVSRFAQKNHFLTAERRVFVVPKPNQTYVFCRLKPKLKACKSCILVGFLPSLLNEISRFDPWGPLVTVVGEWLMVPLVIVTRATLWLCQNSYWSHGPVEIVDLATEHGDLPMSFLYVYQRVYVDNIG